MVCTSEHREGTGQVEWFKIWVHNQRNADWDFVTLVSASVPQSISRSNFLRVFLSVATRHGGIMGSALLCRKMSVMTFFRQILPLWKFCLPCRLNSVEEVLTPRVRLGARHISFAGLLLICL